VQCLRRAISTLDVTVLPVVLSVDCNWLIVSWAFAGSGEPASFDVFFVSSGWRSVSKFLGDSRKTHAIGVRLRAELLRGRGKYPATFDDLGLTLLF